MVNTDKKIAGVEISDVVTFRDAYLDWISADGEFGKIRIFTTEDGKVFIDSEHMSKEFVMAVVSKLVDDAEFVD